MSSSNELKSALTSYLFIFMPFLALVLVKGSSGEWDDLLIASDWSIASAMIYSSSIITVRSATRNHKGCINDTSLDFFMAKTLCMALLSIIIYVLVLVKPNPIIGYFQIILFIFASLSYIKYGRLSYRMQTNTIDSKSKS